MSYAVMMSAKEQHEALQAAVRMLFSWGVDPARTTRILNVDAHSLEGLSNPSSGNELYTDDQLCRADLVIGFGEIISALFQNPVNLRNFASLPNKNAGFDGRSLLDVMENCDTTEWQCVYMTFKAQTMNPW